MELRVALHYSILGQGCLRILDILSVDLDAEDMLRSLRLLAWMHINDSIVDNCNILLNMVFKVPIISDIRSLGLIFNQALLL